MEFKDRIKAVRMEKNVSLAQLAAYLNKSESAVRAWEIERSKPDADTLIKLAEYFDCTTDYLLGISDHKNSDEKADISTLSNDLEEAVLKIDDGKNLLEGLVRFINIIPEKDRSNIMSAYLEIAKDFAVILEEIYRFQADCEETETFNITSFFECYSDMSNTLVSGKHDLYCLSEFPLLKMIKLASDYGSDGDKNLVNSFYWMYQNAHNEAKKSIIKPNAKRKKSPDVKTSIDTKKIIEKMPAYIERTSDKFGKKSK